MEYPLCYRNKAIYAVGKKNGRVVKGFYRASSHDITPVEQCLLQLPLADKAGADGLRLDESARRRAV